MHERTVHKALALRKAIHESRDTDIRARSHDTDEPRITALTFCPNLLSIAGRHGTKLNPIPSSSIA